MTTILFQVAALVVVVVVRVVTGMNPVSFTIQVPVNAFTFGAHPVCFVILPPCFGVHCLVLEAVLYQLSLAVEVPVELRSM